MEKFQKDVITMCKQSVHPARCCECFRFLMSLISDEGEQTKHRCWSDFVRISVIRSVLVPHRSLLKIIKFGEVLQKLCTKNDFGQIPEVI